MIDVAISNLRGLLLYNCHHKKEEFNREFEKFIEHKNSLDTWQVGRLNESSSTGFTILMLACKYGSVEAVKFLLTCGLNVGRKDGHGLTASDYAWENNALSCVSELLQADAPFPEKIDLKLLHLSGEFSQKIIQIADKVTRFHKSIEFGHYPEVQSFVSENPKTRFAYNEKNQSALTTALIFGQTKIYNFLVSLFFETGIDSKRHNSIIGGLSIKSKEEIRLGIKLNLGKPVEKHVLALLSKSRARKVVKKTLKS